MGQLLSNLASGSLVKLAEHTKPTKFIKLDNDHYGTGTGVTLIRKDTFNERQWEASYDGSYKNRYIGCLLDNFCDLMLSLIHIFCRHRRPAEPAGDRRLESHQGGRASGGAVHAAHRDHQHFHWRGVRNGRRGNRPAAFLTSTKGGIIHGDKERSCCQ